MGYSGTNRVRAQTQDKHIIKTKFNRKYINTVDRKSKELIVIQGDVLHVNLNIH